MHVDADDHASSLIWNGERYLPEISGNIRFEHVHRYLLACELAHDRVVLDIACGEGYGADLLASVARHVIGVDAAPESIGHASRRYRRPNLTFRGGSCSAIPLLDASVDVVVSFETIEHHDEHERMLSEMRRVLKPGGLVVISSPDRREYADVPHYQNPYHVRELYREEFEALLRSRFAHVCLVGQEVRTGSIVGPLDANAATRFLTFSDHAKRQIALTPGLRAPRYLIAVASDAPLPRIPIGLMDDGPTDPLEAVATAPLSVESLDESLDRSLPARVVQLEHAEVRRRGQVTNLEQQVARLQRAVNRHREQSVSVWTRSLDDRTRLVDLQKEANSHDVRLEEARRMGAEHAAAAENLRHEVAGLNAARTAADQARAAANEALRALTQTSRAEETRLYSVIVEYDSYQQSLFADLAAARAEQAAIIQKFRTSRSWRVTRPVRAAQRAAVRGYHALARSARVVYHALPLPHRWKMAAKGAIFRSLPAGFHGSAYAAWGTQQDALGALHSAAPTSEPVAAVAADSDQTPPVEAAPLEAAPASLAPVEIPIAGVPIAADPAVPAILNSEVSGDYVALAQGPPTTSSIKPIAFYLPQFHPIPENDAWWGRGFTEWANVMTGRPQFDGHYQPHLPGELGFYDLRVPAVQRRQIELAKQYGVYGFCYYHYWFDGRRLLETPLEQMLANPDLDFPFCLCWANENWTRRWDGAEDDVLIAQSHGDDDDDAFIRQIEPILRDPRYIHIDGKALLVVYRPALLPNAAETAARWRAYGESVGLQLFLVSTHAFDRRDPREFGFDAALEFAPNNIEARNAQDIAGRAPTFAGQVFDYRRLVERSRTYVPEAYPYFRSVTPMWDNEARRPGRGTIYAHSTPALYGEWLANTCRYTQQCLPPEMPFVFINAWNEWAEGAHLEPDRHYGYAYLRATAVALAEFPVHSDRTDSPIVVVSHDAHRHGAQLLALNLVRSLTATFHLDVDVLLCGEGVLTADFEQVARVHDASLLVADADLTATIRRLRAQGATTALCNTAVVGRVVEALKREGFTVISLVHELPGTITARRLEDSVARIARHADHVIFPAEIVRREFLRVSDLDPARTSIRPQGMFAPNPFTGPRRNEARTALRQRLGLAENVRIVLGAGYADLRKGIDLFVEVGRTLVGAIDDVVMVWLGAPYPPALDAAVATIASSQRARFFFPDAVPDFEVFFAGADIFLLTSREDPFPLVVLHALDAGLPVIGFEEAGGFVELLQRGYGVLVPFLNTEAMAAAATRLLGTPAECERLAAAGQDVIAREFAFTSYVRDLLDLVRPPRRRVSVIVPNCNYARYLPERLNSIIRQTVPPHEILFLDDCSTDDSVAVARDLLRNSGLPFRIVQSETRQGTYRQWLRGIAEATGDIVWIAEADDACASTFLETLTPAFDDPHVTLAYCQSSQMDHGGAETAPDYLAYTDGISVTKWRKNYIRLGRDEIRDTLFVINTIPNASAVLLRKPNLAAIAEELLTLKFAGDWLVYITQLATGRIAFVSAVLNSHRRHADSAIAHGGLDLAREIVAVQRHVLARYAISPDVMRLRDEHFQRIYEHLGVHRTGPPTFTEHPEFGCMTAEAHA